MKSRLLPPVTRVPRLIRLGHGFLVALILFAGARGSHALYGVDAVPDDAGLQQPGPDLRGSDPQSGVAGGECGGFVFIHSVDSRLDRSRTIKQG